MIMCMHSDAPISVPSLSGPEKSASEKRSSLLACVAYNVNEFCCSAARQCLAYQRNSPASVDSRASDRRTGAAAGPRSPTRVRSESSECDPRAAGRWLPGRCQRTAYSRSRRAARDFAPLEQALVARCKFFRSRGDAVAPGVRASRARERDAAEFSQHHRQIGMRVCPRARARARLAVHA